MRKTQPMDLNTQTSNRNGLARQNSRWPERGPEGPRNGRRAPFLPRNSLGLTIGLTFLLLTWSTAATLGAQADAPQEDGVTSTESKNGDGARDRWSVSLGGGLLSTNDAPSGTFTFEHPLFGPEQGEFDADYAGGDASLYEVSLGLRLRGPLALGLTWSQSSLSDQADVVGRLPHPFLFGSPRTVEGRSRGLSRDETAIHLSLKWLVRDGEKVQVALFAGPSQIDVDYDLATAVRFDQTYPFDTANYAGVEHRKASGSAIGYHLGIDVAYYFSKSTGLGGVVRFSDASIDLDAPSGGTVAIGGGGLQTAVDLRFRF